MECATVKGPPPIGTGQDDRLVLLGLQPLDHFRSKIFEGCWKLLCHFLRRCAHLEEPKTLATGTGAKAVLCSPRGNVDYMHRSVALTGDEQFVAAECHNLFRDDFRRHLCCQLSGEKKFRNAVMTL